MFPVAARLRPTLACHQWTHFATELTDRQSFVGQIGLRAEPGHATHFRIRFAEEAGDRLPIYESRYPMDFRGRDTGRTATEAKGSIIVDLMVPGHSDPIWRESLVAVSDRSFESDINDATVRQSMLDKLIYSLSGFNFPYFIPEPKDMVALPLMVR